LFCFFIEETFEDENLRNKIEKYEAHFDGRVFSVPSREEGLNNIIWRCLYDCRRNSISGLARWTLGHTECHKKNQKEMLKALTEVVITVIIYFLG
jgi:tRNA(His) 5'-end guanylyltransferase